MSGAIQDRELLLLRATETDGAVFTLNSRAKRHCVRSGLISYQGGKYVLTDKGRDLLALEYEDITSPEERFFGEKS